MSAISSFRSIEKKHDVYRGKDSIKRFCEFLTEYAVEIINFKERKMKILTKVQLKSYENVQSASFIQKHFKKILER